MNKIYATNITPLLDPKIFGELVKKVQPSRREKAEKISFPLAKAQSLGAGLCVKRAVEGCTEYDYDKLVFKTEEKGKPYVEGNLFYFSVSHSKDYAVCAISDSPVGVDIEFETELPERLSKRFLDGKKIDEWTRREAKGKLTGQGFFDSSDGRYVYTEIKKLDGYIITVCSDKEISDLVEFDCTKLV